MQPFGNTLVVMTLTGAQLRQLLEDQQPAGRRPPLSSSSPRLRSPTSGTPRAAHGARVRELRVGGQPVQPQAEYRFTVNNFLAEAASRMAGLRQGRDRVGGMLDVEALGAYLLAEPRSQRQRSNT
jgi:5'-nucleotidase